MLTYILYIASAIIAFVAAFMIYVSNSRFTAGSFKRFSRWIVLTAFIFLFVQIFWLYTFKSQYAGIARETIKSINAILSIAIGISFILLAGNMHNFSKRFGFMGKKMK